MSSADYSCAICLESASDPVVTKCGHLYCWPCLDQWLARQLECPTCKGAVDPEKPGDIIPLYGKGKPSASSSSSDKPRPEAAQTSTAASSEPQTTDDNEERREHAFNTRHQRPRGQREAPPPNTERRGGNWGRGSWGMCLFGAPTFISDPSFMFIIIIVCIALYFIYKYWQERGQGRNRNNEGQNAAPANQQQQRDGDGGGAAAAGNGVPAGNTANSPNLLPALLIMCASLVLIGFLNTIAIDE